MKRRLTAFVLMLALVMLIKLGMPVFAEITAQTGNPYEIALSHCPGIEAPVSADLTKEIASPEGAAWTYKEFPFTTDYSKEAGQVARAVVTMGAMDMDVTDEQWQQMSDFLAGVISRAIPDAGQMDAGEMAEAIARSVDSLMRDAAPDADGALPVWGEDALHLTKLTVQAPFYPELKRGDRSDEVKALQQRMIELGYLDGAADGQFGGMTETAIKAIETELRKREQAVIDAMPTPEPTPEPTLDPMIQPLDADEDQPAPEPAAEETPKPKPATEVDGVADQVFQIRLNSGEFPLIDGALDKGADKDAVTRAQLRLTQLGTLTGKADGDYGGNTRRAVRIFQHYNGLEETGIADEATQRALFSSGAKAPANPLMTTGSTGDAVKQLQTRLIHLGFMSGSADASYGAATQRAVEKLQTYMRAREIEEIERAAASAAEAQADVAPAQPGEAENTEVTVLGTAIAQPTIEVNGVADPLLLDSFYAETFNAVPSALKNGDKNLDVERLQRRLTSLEYLYYTLDGAYGDGTESAVRAFQKRNGLTEDGVAGRATLEVLFSGDALKALKPYVLKVSVDKQRVYAYGLDENNEHTKLVRTMKCSTGLSATPTPKGTYQGSTGPGARWHYFKKFTVWAQYAYYIQGDYMFHSVLYNVKGGSPTSSSVRNLGSRASHGCVRLAVEDAKWIWTNCPKNTKIVVY